MSITLMIIFAAIFAVSLYFSLVIMPKMTAKARAKAEKMQQDFGSSIQGREEEVRQEYLQNNSLVSPFPAQLQDKILGMISCMEKRTTGDFIRQQAVGAAGKVLGRVTGVRVKEVDNEEHYWLAFTEANLHYLHYNDSGNCVEHLSFQLARLQNMEMGTPSTEELFTGKAEVGVKRLSFESNDIKYKFFYYDNLWGHPKGKCRKDHEAEAAELNYLFARPFKQLLDRFAVTA